MSTFSLEAVGSGRSITEATLGSRGTVLVFHGPRTTEAPKVVGKAVRAAFPSAAEVVVVNVVALKSMAGLWKKVAVAQMNATYEKMAAKVDDGPAFVIICPDWEDAVAPRFGIMEPDTRPGVVVLGRDGTVAATIHDGDLGAAAVTALRAL